MYLLLICISKKFSKLHWRYIFLNNHENYKKMRTKKEKNCSNNSHKPIGNILLVNSNVFMLIFPIMTPLEVCVWGGKGRLLSPSHNFFLFSSFFFKTLFYQMLNEQLLGCSPSTSTRSGMNFEDSKTQILSFLATNDFHKFLIFYT
jgi:hypothetical protein